ncbi:MAG: peptidase M14 [Runella slithyformis]|nr:MAG: peptidase M14 [Runella slithyformis]
MTKRLSLSGLLALLCGFNVVWSQSAYNNHAQLSGRLKALTTQYASLASVQSIGKSTQGRDLWVLAVGKNTNAKKPAVLIVGGLEGVHLAGSEMVLQMAEKMLATANTDSVAKLLETKTFYFLPNGNPDAQEQFSAKLKYERSGNGTETDDDRDGRNGEDPFEDLNNDGIISTIRVEDPTGTFVVSKEDPRILLKADPNKGETGKYLVMTEGIDNDKDGAFNEDGPGGVHIDKNFTFEYPVFNVGAGDYAASESETRAVLDFLYKTNHIFAVLTFGPNNNLSEAPKFDPTKALKKIPNGPSAKDAAVGEQVSKIYNSRTGLKDAPALPQSKGNFAQTAYYHAGRLSFTTPGWWVPKTEAPKDTTKKAATPATVAPAGGAMPRAGMMGAMGAAAPANNAGEDELRLLKWADKEKLSVYSDWKTIQHPDFVGKKVEVGGFMPFAKLNPPVSYLNEAATKHLKFITELGQQMPEIELVNLKTESLGNGLSRVSVQVLNKGLLPTYAEIGDRVRWVSRVKTELKLSAGQSFVSGKRLYLRNALGAGEQEEYTWLVMGAGKVILEAGCPTAGIKTAEVVLK